MCSATVNSQPQTINNTKSSWLHKSE